MIPSPHAVFLDKDGTLIRNVPFNVDPAAIELLPGVREGLAALASNGYTLIVVSNQPGVALGRFAEAALGEVRRRLTELFAEAGAELAGFLYCPHHPQGSIPEYASRCQCRKPEPGLILQACRDFPIRLSRSWLVGDILDDVEAGRRAGCRTVLLNNGGETEWRVTEARRPDRIVGNFLEAVEAILGDSETEAPLLPPLSQGERHAG